MNEVIPSSNLKENYQGTMAAAWDREFYVELLWDDDFGRLILQVVN